MWLSNVAGALHGAVKPTFVRFFEQEALPLQLGSRAGKSVVFASHIMQAFLRWKARNGVVFADIQSAYYRTIRELAVPGADQANVMFLSQMCKSS